SPTFDSDPLWRNAEVLQQHRHLRYQRLRPAHEAERLWSVNERRQFAWPKPPASALPAFGRLASDGLSELNLSLPLERQTFAGMRELGGRAGAVERPDALVGNAERREKHGAQGCDARPACDEDELAFRRVGRENEGAERPLDVDERPPFEFEVRACHACRI